jgi:neutral ceramidase
MNTPPASAIGVTGIVRSIMVAIAVAGAATCQTGGLKLGTGTSVVTPFLDESIAGYYYDRTADGVHDDLYAKALLIDNGTDRIVLVACDLVRMPKAAVEDARRRIERRLGIPADHVLISATHSHTGPKLSGESIALLARRIADSVVTANGNLKEARLFVATEQEASLPHSRRYLMKDRTTVTNPGFLNPNVLEAVGPTDPRVPVVYAEDERGQAIMTWVNYAMHLDTVGGTLISADYAYYLARLLARVKGTDMLTIFTIGAAGNINHWDVRRPGPQRGLAEAQRLGEVLGAAVLKAYTHMEAVSSPAVRAIAETIELAVPMVTAEQVAAARKLLTQPPPRDVDFSLDRVNAGRIVSVAELGGRGLFAEIQVLAVGPIAFVGIPGELFSELGIEIQRASPFPYTFIVGQANDAIGYIPTKAAFEQGGYEPTNSRMAPGGGERIAAKVIALLKQCHR